MPQNLFIMSRSRKLVPGLRDSVPPSDVKVYRMNDNGEKGELLRIETPKPIKKKKFNEGD